MNDNEVFENDDMDSKPTPSDISVPDFGDIPLKTDNLREQQKKDIIKNDETYETELGPNEKNIPVTKERFDNTVKPEDIPIVSSPKDVVEEAKKKYSFHQDENHPIPTKKDIPTKEENVENDDKDKEEAEEIKEIKPNKIDDIKNAISSKFQNKTVSPDSLDEDEDSKEYISRYDTIYSEKNEVEKYTPRTQVAVYEEEIDDEEKKNPIRTIFIILLFLSILLGGIILISQLMGKPIVTIYHLSDDDKRILTEEYSFISATSDYLQDINDLVEKEKEIIDNYVSKDITKETLIENLDNIVQDKQKIKDEYIKLTPVEEEVIETKKLSDKIINNTIAFTEDTIKYLNINSNAKLVGNFNKHVEENNSNIYMYNQYVMSVFKKRNITITYDGINFAMDTTWIDK